MREGNEFEVGEIVLILRSSGVTRGVVVDFDDCEGRWWVLSSEDEKLLLRTCELASSVDKPVED